MANIKGSAMQQTIRTLRRQGMGIRAIARMLGISRNTVRNYVSASIDIDIQTAPPDSKVPTRSTVQTDPPAERVPTGSEDDSGTLSSRENSNSSSKEESSESSRVPARSQSKCLPFKEIIDEKIKLQLHAQRIHQDLVHEHGFEGSYDSVKRFVRRLTHAGGIPHRRMELPPGLEAQVDFGKGAWLIGEDGKRHKTHMFRLVLSNSRAGYTEVVRRQDTESFIRALENGFRHFGGVPQTLVPDNLKAAVLIADKYDPELNPKMKSFAEHYNTVVLPTPPYRPELKGKVERGVGYAFKSALKGRTFPSLAAQNKHLRWWESNVADTRIHGTTQKQVRAALELEKPFLLPLPPMLFPVFEEGKRIVSRDGHVEVSKSYYSAPPEFLGRDVWVRWDARVVRIFHPVGFRMVRMHARVEPGMFATHAADIPARRISSLERGEHYLLRELKRIDHDIHAWGKAMLQTRGIAGVRVLQGLCNLARKTKTGALSSACKRALPLQMWRLAQIRRLVKEAPVECQQELQLVQSHPIIRELADYRAAFGPMHKRKPNV